jgi:pimeloyl-ACP methyl ester carboxylesterase
MPVAEINGINLSFDDYGSGEAVILVAGSTARGRTWKPYQVPALTGAGYRVITVDNRGVPPSDRCPEGFTVDDMVADTFGLIKFLGIGPCRIVGFSLGGMIVQELLLAYPGLITQAVLIATRGRTDALRRAMSAADAELLDSGIELPPRYRAVMRAMHNLSPRTHSDEQQLKDWLEIFELSSPDPALRRAHMGLDVINNRLEEYRKIRNECLVIGFQDDLMVPPKFCREVADSIPVSRYKEIGGCGHYGYIERYAEVNSCIVNFFGGTGEFVGTKDR